MAATIPEFLIHVTPAGNVPSIQTHGLDPRRKYPERVGTRSFVVESSQLMWSLAHMSARYSVPVNKLAVLRFNAYPQRRIQIFKKIGFLPGVYYTDIPALIAHYEPILGSVITEIYQAQGGELPDLLWQLTEYGGLG